MTLRFFPLIVSAVQFVIIAGLTDYLGVGGFLSTMFAESIVSVLSAIVQFVVKLMPCPPEGGVMGGTPLHTERVVAPRRPCTQ